MLSSKIKDLKIRNSLKKIEKIRNVKKFLFVSMLQKNFSVKKSSAIIAFMKDNKGMKSKSKTRMVNRCILNNRSRGTLRPFGISRTLMRELMQFGVVPGYSKAVW
jgi:ribosomal protein S14